MVNTTVQILCAGLRWRRSARPRPRPSPRSPAMRTQTARRSSSRNQASLRYLKVVKQNLVHNMLIRVRIDTKL